MRLPPPAPPSRMTAARAMPSLPRRLLYTLVHDVAVLQADDERAAELG